MQEGSQTAGTVRRGRHGHLVLVGVFVFGVAVAAVVFALWYPGPGGEPTAAATPLDVDEAEEADASAEEEDAPERPEPTPTPSPEPVPTPTPVDLATLDWTEVEWRTNCIDGGGVGEPSPVQVAPVSAAESTVGRAGTYEYRDGSDIGASAFVVDVANVQFGDVTGDGRDDAVFEAMCIFGNTADNRVEVWSSDPEGQPVHLPPPVVLHGRSGAVEDVEILDGALRVHRGELAHPDDHWAEGFPQAVVTDWRWTGAEWSASESYRLDVGQIANSDTLPGTAGCPADLSG